jgi:hypothetical protein
MFVPMWMVWVAVAVVLAPLAHDVCVWVLALSFAPDSPGESSRKGAYDPMDHARWPPGDPRGQPDVIADDSRLEGPEATK